MGCFEKREARNPTHVSALLLTEVRREVHLCFVQPVVAMRDGRNNPTLPGGGIHQLGSRKFETPEVALVRETEEEIGSPRENLYRCCRIGPPVLHQTAKGQDKLIQPFVGILLQPYDQPKFQAEIAEVSWCDPAEWAYKLAAMNEGKRRLALRMLQEAATLKELFPCMRRSLRNFLEETSPVQFTPQTG